MTECRVCGDGEQLGFVCKLCGCEHCARHQLPENHDCPGLETYDRDQSWFYSGEATVRTGTESAERYRREAPTALEHGDMGRLPGATPDARGSSSPDVAPDGSVSTPDQAGEAPEGPGSDSDGRFRWWIRTHVERYRTRPSALLVDVLWLLLVVGIVTVGVAAVSRLLL